MQSEYQERIVNHVVTELKAGRTPSPDILCNQWIKFGLFLDKIEPGFDKIASGHYAQVEERDGQFWLKRSPDPVKDQTYFLSRLSQQQLNRILFPIGHLLKSEVRAEAQRLNLPNRDRRDSQGICFLGKIKYPEFVRFHLGEKTGDIINIETGQKLAEHKGVWFHTVGQRKGLGMGGGPWYVVKKDLEKNIVYVAHSERYLDLARKEFTVTDPHWINGDPFTNGGAKFLPSRPNSQNSPAIEPHPAALHLQTKVRHSPRIEPCIIEPLPDNRLKITLAEKDQGIAPGQSAVFYHGEYCLGSGVIE
jgi:tRNA-specific 2-thiouridylase